MAEMCTVEVWIKAEISRVCPGCSDSPAAASFYNFPLVETFFF